MTKIIVGLLLFILFAVPSKVSAHVLLKDEAANIGAIVHINPDDDPVAGETTQIYIDIQDQNASARIPRSGYLFYISNAAGEREQVETSLLGTVLDASYVFENRGLYTLEIVSDPAYDSFQKVAMTYNLRVSRGAGTQSQQESYGWAEIGLPAVSVGIIMLWMYGFNNRKNILANSKF